MAIILATVVRSLTCGPCPTGLAATTATAALAVAAIAFGIVRRCNHLNGFAFGLGLFDDIVFNDILIGLIHRIAHQPSMARNHRRMFRHKAGGGLELFNRVVGADQRWIGLDPHAHPITGLDQRDMFALLVEEEVHNPDRCLQQHLFRAFARALFFQRAQNLQRHAVIRPDQPSAMAMRARLGGAFQHPRTQTLAAHLHQAKARDATHLNPRAVGFQLVLQALFDGRVVATLFHVDKVDDDQTRKVTQTQLAGHLIGGLKVGLERGVLNRPFFRGATRVHVDRNQRFGHADHDIAARFQLNRRVEHAAKVAFHLIAGEQRGRVGIADHLTGMAGHDHPHEGFGGAISCLTLDQHFLDLFGVKIADRAFDEVTLFIDRRGRDGFQRQLADLFPQAHQIFVVALNLGLGALGPRRADDQASTFRNLDLARDFFQLLTVCGLGDLAADTATAGGVGHENAITACQRQIGGQRRTLVAALFFHHLHQHDLAHLDDFLDLVAPRPRTAGLADFFGHILFGNGFDVVIGVRGMVDRVIGVVVTMALVSLIAPARFGFGGLIGIRLGVRLGFGQIDHIHRGNLARGHFVAGRGAFGLRAGLWPPARTRPAVFFLFLRAVIGALFLDQRLTVGDRDLIVIGVNLGKGQEPVAIATVIDKGRLQGRLHAGDLGQIDVSCKLALVQGFKVEFFNLVSVDHNHAGFFRMCGIDEHFL